MKLITPIVLFLYCGITLGQLNLGPAASTGCNGIEDVFDVDKDSSGNWIFAGVIPGNAPCLGLSLSSDGIADGFIVQYSPIGTRNWVISFGSNQIDELNAIAIEPTTDNIVAVGFAPATMKWNSVNSTALSGTTADYYVVKYSQSGTLVWGKVFGGAGTEDAFGVAIDANQLIYVTGYTTVLFTYPSTTVAVGTNILGGRDIFVTVFDSTGTALRSQTFGGNAYQEPRDIAVNSLGDIFVVGWYNSTNWGSFTPATNQNIVILRLDNQSLAIQNSITGSCSAGDGVARTVAIDSGLNVIAGGFCKGNFNLSTGVQYNATTSSQNAWLLKFNQALNVTSFGTIFPSNGDASVNDIAVGLTDTIYITGNYPLGTNVYYNAGGGNLTQSTVSMVGMFAAKYGSNGDYYWSTDFSGQNNGDSVQGKALALNTGGATAAYGATFRGTTVTFSNFTIGSQNSDAAFLMFADITLPSPTPTPSPSVTPSITPTPSVTPSVTPSNSRTPSVTPSHSPSPSVTPSISPSNSPSASMSASPAASSSPSASASQSPPASPSISMSSSPAPTPSSSPSATPSVVQYYSQVTMKLDGTQSSFNQTQFLDDIASVLSVTSDIMKIVSVTSKSTFHVCFNIYDLYADSVSLAQQLVSLVDSNSTELTDLGIVALDIQVDYSHARNKPTPSVSSSHGAGNSNSQTIIIAVVVSVGVVGLVGVAAAFFVRRQRAQSNNSSDVEIELPKKHPRSEVSVASQISQQPDEPDQSEPKKKNKLEIDYKSLTIENELGRGAFGIVYLAKWRKVPVVVKQLDQSQGSQAEAFMKEANNVKDMRPHPNVCPILGVCLDPQYPICIVMEYVPYGSLWDMILSKKLTMNQDLLIDFAMDVASGMSHLHSENIIHCDLACRNLLVAPKQGGSYTIKITDFGLSRVTEQDLYNANINAVFPVRWTAPETIRGRIISRASDVWSFGVTLWEMAEGKQPYPELSNPQVITAVCDKGVRLPKPATFAIPDELYAVMMACWADDPKQRPSFDTICKELSDINKKVRGATTFADFSEGSTSHREGYESTSRDTNSTSRDTSTSHMMNYGNSTSTSRDTPSHVGNYGNSTDEPVLQQSRSDNSTASHDAVYGNNEKSTTVYNTVGSS